MTYFLEWKDELISTVTEFEVNRKAIARGLFPLHIFPKYTKDPIKKFIKMSWGSFHKKWGSIADRMKICPDADIFIKHAWEAIDQAKVIHKQKIDTHNNQYVHYR